MTPEQIDEYLSRPMIADLATVNLDGSPHVAPVWFRWDGEVVKVFTQTTAVKVRNIRQDARVAVSVATQEAPYGYVIVNGTAEISDEGFRMRYGRWRYTTRARLRGRFIFSRRFKRWSFVC